VQEFYRRKKERHQKKIKRLELIKKYDQEALDKANFMSRITRNISYYETIDGKKWRPSSSYPNPWRNYQKTGT
jgi:hypothetical protein